MIKDLSAKLVAAAAAINQKSREAYVAEQRQLEVRKDLKAKHASMMPVQPAPKADPAAVSTAKKMAEAVEGSVPKTPREKELAAKSGNSKRITFGDVLKARGVKEEGWNPIKHIPKQNQNDAIKKAAKDVKRGSYADRAALLRAGGVKEETEAVEEGWDDMIKDSRARSAAQGTGKFDTKKTSTGTVYTRKSSTFEDGGKDADMKKADKKAKTEGFMDTMRKMGKKVVDTVTHGDDVDLIKDLQKKVGVPQTGIKPKRSEEAGEKGETAAQEKAEKNKNKPKMAHDFVKEDIEQIDELSKSTLGSYVKKASRDAVIKRKTAADFEHQAKRAKSPGMKAASDSISQSYKVKSWKRRDGIEKAVDRLAKEEFECLEVQHEQFGLGKTLGQFSEDMMRVDVMFAEGIKRVSIDEIEMVEETTAIHPSAIHVSPAPGNKYKVHAVGKKFASGIKVGEHLTDTHLDDFSEMGGKIKMVKAPKKA